MKNPINAIIERTSKRNLVLAQPFHFRFGDKDYYFKLYRHYDKSAVSICNRETCNAGDDCCHLVRVAGIGLCVSRSSFFTLRVCKDLSCLFAQGIRSSEENDMVKFAQNVLDAISGKREVEMLTQNEIENFVRWD